MDWGKLWNDFLAAMPNTLSEWQTLGVWLLGHPVSRSIILILIVLATIRVIAAVYSGDKQKAELGPVAIRQHQSGRYREDMVRLHRDLMEMNMDGVSARCKVVYVYTDAKAKRRRKVVHDAGNVQLSISPSKIRTVDGKIDGQEIPDVPTNRVCFPPFEIAKFKEPVPRTPERARDYAELHGILRQWHDDDAASLISVSEEFAQSVATGKEQFVAEEIAKIDRAAAGKGISGVLFRKRLERRPNVVGSYYLKFEFSHDPMFVLTRHPDRDLKMTAWLTILTSMFALIMDWWPNGGAPFGIVAPAEAAQPAERAPSRVVRVP